MKKGFIVTILGVVRSIKHTSVLYLAVLLCALVILLAGCQQSGETLAKGERRHQRNLNINQESLNADLDRLFLFDQPSKLTQRKLYPEIDD